MAQAILLKDVENVGERGDVIEPVGQQAGEVSVAGTDVQHRAGGVLR